MKCLVIIIILFSQQVFSRDTSRKILKCLGEEEKRFHIKKENGPMYDLNQRLIAEIVQIPKVELRTEEYLKICTGQKSTESLKLLEYSIKSGKEIFVISDNIQGSQRSMTIGMIDDYASAVREILLNFISQIQLLSPSPNCLKEQIPELEKFLRDIKYLQEDVDMKNIFIGQDQKIFERLKNYPLAFAKCRALLKKKAKSLSKEAPKKS